MEGPKVLYSNSPVPRRARGARTVSRSSVHQLAYTTANCEELRLGLRLEKEGEELGGCVVSRHRALYWGAGLTCWQSKVDEC